MSVMYSAANVPRPEMILRPEIIPRLKVITRTEMIPDVDCK